jgi:hypothetical protein
MTASEFDLVDEVEAWRDDLLCQLKRARLKAELIGLDPEQEWLLHRQVDEFKRVVGVINGLAKVEAEPAP